MFNHLHVHTEYSPLDGLARIEDLIVKAKECGQTAMAITDHGSTSGLIEAIDLGKKHNFKIIAGSEFYVENKVDTRKHGHLILLAANNVGLQNLFALQRYAYMENFYYNPRINNEILKEHSEGLICTTACMANSIAQYILIDENVMALEQYFKLKEIFDDNLYLEYQAITLPEQLLINSTYEKWVNDGLGKAIITNDIHYVNKEDAYTHEVLLAIQQNKKMDDPKRWKFDTNEFYLKTEQEVLETNCGLKETSKLTAFKMIQEIVDKCDTDYYEKVYTTSCLPSINTECNDEYDVLFDKTMEKYSTRIKDRGEDNEEFFNDLIKELSVIEKTGYSGYFLIVDDYVQFAKQNGILVGDGRGSGVNSKVAYTLGITETNPQKYGLLFERFLSEGREPDFDIDFSDIDSVFEYLQNKYGHNSVARVGAFTRLTAKSAIRKVMSVFGFTQKEIKNVIDKCPNKITFSFAEALAEEEVSKFFNKHNELVNIIALIENITDHFSTHAGGVIIFKDLDKHLPVLRDKNDHSKMIIGLDKDTLAKYGHHKFDILGLSSLNVIGDTIKYIGDPINWLDVDFEDQNIYDMLCRGDVHGVFQLSDQSEKIVEQQPRNFEDLIAVNALIRPGVGNWDEYIYRRNNDIVNDDILAPYLDSTNGIIVYQEQYLQIAKTYAGWNIAYSDKAIRKNPDILNDEELKEKWHYDCSMIGNTKSTEHAEALWSDICHVVSSGYGFNRGHSTSYARLSFQTAYLKYYYPREFYAALLNVDANERDKILKIQELLSRLSIPLYPPDINKSEESFIPYEDGILSSIYLVDGMGVAGYKEISRLRPIKSLEDFMERRIPKFIKINTIENLIKSGAFDFELSRYEMLLYLQKTATKKFEVEEKDNYHYEKDATGLFLTGSPYEKYDIPDFNRIPEDKVFATIGEVIDVAVRKDKNDNEMAFVIMSNQYGTFKVVVFSSTWRNKQVQDTLTKDSIVLVKGKKSKGSLLLNSTEGLL